MKMPEVETAIRIYYENSEIGNSEIRLLFGNISTNTSSRLKKAAREIMLQRDIHTVMPTNVNTKAAFDAWGLDITDMEQRYKRLKALSLRGKEGKP